MVPPPSTPLFVVWEPCLQGSEAANREANATLDNVRQALGFTRKL
jgi:hypothetical protein